MGLFDFVKNQFIEVTKRRIFSRIGSYLNSRSRAMKSRWARSSSSREGQCAIFLSEGALADVFGPGRCTLSTENMPVLSS